MMPTVSQIRDELADREAIRDCLFRYCRGIDRHDGALVASAYWPGAMDYHTGFTGTVEQFVEWAMPRMAELKDAIHMLGQILLRLDGDKAEGESYFWSTSLLPGGGRQVLSAGRYLDRFEKRGDEWRIAERIVAHDWFSENDEVGDWSVGPFGMTGLLRGAPAGEDASYTRLSLLGA